LIGGRRPLHGRKAADLRVRVERPHSAYFRYAGPNQLVAKQAASIPRTSMGRAMARARSVLFGRPLSIYEELSERLGLFTGLPIFASDNISSSAYATEEIMRVLIIAGARNARPDHADYHRDRHRAGDRRHQLSPDDRRVPIGRRLLHRRERQPRHAARPRGGGSPAD